MPTRGPPDSSTRASSEAIDATIEALARVYEERRLDVIKRMTANAIERVRTAAIRTFSDAFLLRRKKDDA